MKVVEPADVVVLAAHALELAPLERALRERPPRDLRCATCVVGVGLPAAGAGTTRAVLERQASAAVLVGSAGVYPGRFPFKPAEPVRLATVELVDASAQAGKAAYPPPMETRATADHALSAALGADLRAVHVAATTAITLDDALARELAARSTCDVENLEALSVGLACAGLGIPFAALLAITNEVGAHGHDQWLAHHATAAEVTCALVARWLYAGAPGLPAGRA